MLQDEINFWNQLQKKYLEPLKENKAEQEKIANDLRELRNRVSRCKNVFNNSVKEIEINSSCVFFYSDDICIFLLQCTLVSDNVHPSNYWWHSLHKDPKGLPQWDSINDRNIFSWSNCAHVSTGLYIIAVDTIFCNALPQVTIKVTDKHLISILHLTSMIDDLWKMLKLNIDVQCHSCCRIYTLIHFVAYADTETRAFKKKSQVSQSIK